MPSDDGELLAGLQAGLATFEPDTGESLHVAVVEPEAPGNRLNDATAGPDGCVWFGSMDDRGMSPTERCYRGEGMRVSPGLVAAMCITNGPALSPDDRVLYYVDTVGGRIHAATLDADGEVTATRPFAEVATTDGHRDGAICDGEGAVWVGPWARAPL